MLKSFAAIFCLGLMIPLYSMKKIAKFNKASLNKITKLNKRDYWVSLGFSGTLNKGVDIPDRVVERYKKDYQVSCDKDISSTIREFYRYAYLAKWQDRTSDEVKTLPMYSKKVDNFWHTFLLFNKDYEQFCKNLPQKKMIARAFNFIRYGELFSMLYHNPYPDEQKCPEACQYYAKKYFKEDYEWMYGFFPSEDIWTGLKKCENCSVEQRLQERKQELAARLRKTEEEIAASISSIIVVGGIIGSSRSDSSSSSSKSSSSCSSYTSNSSDSSSCSSSCGD